MLKAAALVYALVMALIIGILSGSIVLYSYMSSLAMESWRQKEKLTENINSGINLLLSDQDIIGSGERKKIDLFQDHTDSVLLERKNWGVLEIISASAEFKGTQICKIALAGSSAGPDSTTCFYLCESDRPLAVCGKTFLKGTCFLPKQGIRTAYIEGKNFVGDKPVEGIIKNSQRDFPPFNKDIFNYLEDMLSGKFSDSDSIVNVNMEDLPDSVSNLFSSKTLVIYSPGLLTIPGKTFRGNICIRSGSKVIVSKYARLDNVIICAPEIVVEEKFSGPVQLFASDSIIIKKNVKLIYPSAAGIIRTERSKDNIYLGLEQQVRIDGDVFCLQKNNDNKKISCLSLAGDDTIAGQVFSSDCMSFTGTVWGSVACNHLLLKTASAIYENHLLDAVVDRSRLSPYYAGMNLWNVSRRKKIALWLD